MSMATAIYALAEACLGRKRLWRFSRRLYLTARRDGSLDFEKDGELEVIASLAQWSKDDNRSLMVLDVGANRGEWTLALIRALRGKGAPRARIVAFEPVPSLAESLRAMAAGESEGADVSVVESALSNREGALSFVVTDGGGDHHLAARDFAFQGQTIEVAVSTVDRWCELQGIDRIDFVKIDAEGFDPLVIEGAARMLQQERIALIQIEYGAPYIRSRTYLYDVFQMVEGTRYKVGRLTRQGVELFDQWHFDLEHFYGGNYLIVHDTVRHRMACRDVKYDLTNAYD